VEGDVSASYVAVHRNARAEANATLGKGWRPLVLEPSPVEDTDETYMAEDPMAPSEGEGLVVVPLAKAHTDLTITWNELVQENSDLRQFASERWLGAWARLKDLPETYATTRHALHLVGAYLVSPMRRVATGKIGLRHCLEGFGTPFFLDPGREGKKLAQLRVELDQLVWQRGDEVSGIPLTTIADASLFLGMTPDITWASTLDIPELPDINMPLVIDVEAASSLAALYGFAFSVLEELRADPKTVEPTRPQLWPEYFDVSLEAGTQVGQDKASFGVSPGDKTGYGGEPYLYIMPWYPLDLSDPFWNSSTFPGAVLTYDQLLASADQRQVAIDFFARGRELLSEHG